MNFFNVITHPWLFHKDKKRQTFSFILYLPFSYSWILRHQMGGSRTVLDLGCGDGALMSFLNKDKRYQVTGIDLFRPDLKKAKETGVYSKLIYGDIRKLKIKKNSFDLVFSSQVIEHLEKKEAVALIKILEKIAKKKLVLGTTNGFFPFERIEGNDNNPLQVHKSGWSIKEFKKMGYEVYGQGIGAIYKPGGLGHRVIYLRLFLYIFSYLLSPLIYFYPNLSAYLIAVKRK